jgi:hypothetical protein
MKSWPEPYCPKTIQWLIIKTCVALQLYLTVAIVQYPGLRVHRTVHALSAQALKACTDSSRPSP